MKILCSDFGTSSVKTGIYNENLDELCSAKVSYTYDVNGLEAQISPDIVYAAFLKTLPMLGEMLNEIDAVAIDNFSPSVIAMDKNGDALFPCIIHLDRRSYKESRQALKLVPKEDFLRINGNLPFSGGISLTSILWLQNNYPELIDQTYKIGHLNTFILKKLTGKFHIDPSNASFTGLYETFTGNGWSPEITSALGIDTGLLPDIVPSLSLIGSITPEASRQTGIKVGTPVIMGSNDSAAAAFGAGATNPGDIMNISGSSEIMTITTQNPVPHPRLYLRTSVEADKWLYLSITVGGFALEWFRSNFCREMSADEFYGTYLAETISCMDHGTVRFLPHLSGDRHSLVKKRGGFSGLTADSTREDMLRALLVGTFDPMQMSLSIVGKTTKLNPKVFLTGGVVSEAYTQFKERFFSDYTFSNTANCSSRGMAKAAARVLSQK